MKIKALSIILLLVLSSAFSITYAYKVKFCENSYYGQRGDGGSPIRFFDRSGCTGCWDESLYANGSGSCPQGMPGCGSNKDLQAIATSGWAVGGGLPNIHGASCNVHSDWTVYFTSTKEGFKCSTNESLCHGEP